MDDRQRQVLSELRGEIAAADGRVKMFIGLDGFVDEIIHVVDKRTDFQNFERIPTIAALGEKISRAAGLSMNFEFVRQQEKLGGNGPIFANALVEYGNAVTYVGSIGDGAIHPVFAGLTRGEGCRAIGLCEPGHTDAVEFEDGKLMLGKYAHLDGAITWPRLKEALGGAAEIAKIADDSALFGMENWTMVPRMSGIWEGMIAEVFPLMKTTRKAAAFFDLADPEKRTQADIRHAMDLIKRFAEKFYAVLGLNEKECYEIADVMGVAYDDGDADKLPNTCKALYAALGVDCLVVHPTKMAMCCTAEGFSHAAGPYCQKPVLTTGAGDNFNAGFVQGLCMGLPAEKALLLGVATSGYYVRNAKSPTRQAVAAFIGAWLDGAI